MYGYIYRTTDTSNGKIYIGQHKSEVFDPSYNGSGKIIVNIKQVRPQDLTTEVIEWCETRSELNEREKYWITTFDSQNREVGYNLAEGGEGGVTRIGFKHTEETKEKIRNTKVGEKNPMYGKKATTETRQKMSKSQRGRRLSEETKQKMSEAMKGNTNFSGHTHSEETKQKLRLIAISQGRVPPSHKGYHHSDDSKQKIGEANKGKTPWNKGKTGWKKGKQQQKHIFITLDYDLAVMGKSNAYMHHPDWVLVE